MNYTSQNKNPFWIKLLPKFLQTRLKGRYNLFAVLHNSGWLVFDKMIRGLLGLLVGAWVARYLGPSQYGQLAYVLAYIAFFQAVATLGLDGIVVRDIAKFQYLKQNESYYPNKDPDIKFNTLGELLGTAFTLRLITGFLCWFLAIIIMATTTDGFTSQSVYLTTLAGGSLVFQAADTIDLWFQSQTQSKRTVLAKMIAYLISNGLRVVFILYKLPLVYFAMALFIEYAFAAAALYYSYAKFTCKSQWISNIKTVGKLLLKESWPFILSAISGMIYMRADQIMIHSMLDDTQVGLFSTAITIGSITYYIPFVLNIGLLPKLTQQRQMDYQLYEKKLYLLFRLYLMFSIGLSVIIAFFSKYIVNVIFGIKYFSSADVLSIFIFTNIPVFLGVGQNAWLLNENKAKLLLLQTVCGSIVSVILNLFFIPLYGIKGAAYSALISQTVSCIVVNFFVERKLFYYQIGINYSKLKNTK